MLLVQWLQLPPPEAGFDFFELFSGKQAVTRVMPGPQSNKLVESLRQEAGYRVASYDWAFHKEAMNFLGAPGFVFLGSYHISRVACRGLQYGFSSTWSPTGSSWLRRTAAAGVCPRVLPL